MSMEQEPFREETVTFEGSAGKLAGTLAVPSASSSRGSVVILPGSGRADRDGNNKRLAMGIYRDLAHALSGQGFVTLRYDKRGIGQSQGDSFAAGFWDLVDDAKAAVEFLQARSSENPSPIILLGHSEGCIIAPAVNVRLPVQGLIMLAGACESLSVTLPRQQERAVEDLRKMAGFLGVLIRALHVAERQGRKSRAVMARIMASDRPWIRISGFRMNAKWIREHVEYDVARDLPSVRCPTLAISGTKDIQVLPEHARLIAETVAGPAEWHIIPDMTHLLRRTSKSVSMVTLTKLYKLQCKEPVDAELLSILSAWLDARFPRGDH
jgi:alpha/beta superfamily hydrolase